MWSVLLPSNIQQGLLQLLHTGFYLRVYLSWAYSAEGMQSHNPSTVLDSKAKLNFLQRATTFTGEIFFQDELAVRSDPPPRKLTSSSNPMASPSNRVPLCRGGEELDKGHIHPSLLLTYFSRKWNDQNEEFGHNPIYIYFHQASHWNQSASDIFGAWYSH